MPPYQDQNGQPLPPQSPPDQAPQPGQPQAVPPAAQPQLPPQQYQPFQNQPVAPQPQASAPLKPLHIQEPGYSTAPPSAPQPGQQQYPQQPGVYVQPPAGPDPNPYSFFLENSQTAPKRSFKGSSGSGSSSMVMRLVIALGALTALVVAGIVTYSVLFSAPDNTDRLRGIANNQQELIRVSRLGTTNVDGEKLENFAFTASLTLNSSQKELLAYLDTAGVKIDPKALEVTKDAKTDEALKAAEAANTYDPTYTAIMQNGLVKYEAQLSQAIQAATAPKEKAVLQKQHATALLLIKQLGVQPS